ncbi:hypothetical protein [Periweissella beninensis]|uniref:hypothetical protein n=1 Tax=Periweissella beninensis TaxID=504936 RepID=UPI0021A6C531|nr:hypothetical protein [Periweissella beninensis]MCT4395782.1 hypothetical protein [Periweissella beninensis]
MPALTIIATTDTSATVSASSTWHKGTPKKIRGSWYFKQNSDYFYHTFYKNSDGSNYLAYSKHYRRYYKLPSHGQSHMKYQKLSKNLYRLRGKDMTGHFTSFKVRYISRNTIKINGIKEHRKSPVKLISALKGMKG